MKPALRHIGAILAESDRASDTGFTPELRTALERGVARLGSGARLIVTTQPFESPRVRLLRRPKLTVQEPSLEGLVDGV